MGMSVPRPKANGSESTGVALPGFGVGDAQALLSIGEVAELLKVPVSWVYERTRRRSADRIPGFRLGKYWRFRYSEVLAWLERQRTGVKPNA